MRSVCRDEKMPSLETVFRWIRTNNEFREQYTRAKEESADALFDEIQDIADDGTNDWMTIETRDGYEKEVVNHEAIARSKLRVDTRKWMASKMKPKKYGDRLELG